MDFLRDLPVERQAVGGFRRERNEAGTGWRRKRRAVAAVDVAMAQRLDLVEAGDRDELHVGEVPGQLRAEALLVDVLEVLPVDRDSVATEVGHEVVGAGLDDVGAEQDCRTVEIQRVDVEQRIEPVRRVIVELQPRGAFVVAAETVVAAGRRVVDPIVAMLVEHRRTRRPVGAQRSADRAFEVCGAIGAVADVGVALRIRRRAVAVDLDDAGWRIAAEQRALGAAQHFDLADVEQRKALQDRVFLHHVVENQRYRLRGVEVEVGVAEAADVEARERAAERRFDQQARHACRKELDVVAGGLQFVDLLLVDCRDRDRHFLYVLDAFFRCDRDHVQRLGRSFRRRSGRLLGPGVKSREGARDAKGQYESL